MGATFVADLVQKYNNTLRICIIDQRSPPNYDDCILKQSPDLRTYALSPSSISYLKELNIWPLIEPRSHPYTSMKIWETMGPGILTFNASDVPNKACLELGRIVEDRTVLASIYKIIHKANINGNVKFMFGSTFAVQGISLDKHQSMPNCQGPVKVTLAQVVNAETKEQELKVLTSRCT